MNKKAIYAEDLVFAIRDDPSIKGKDFAKIKRHIEAAPEILIKNKPRFIVKPKKVSREELIALQNGPVILHTEDEHIVPICQDRWIPVTERVPEGDKVVLCYKADRGIRLGKLLVATYANGVQAFMDRDMVFAFGVTHWMPLPQPPKED